LSCATLKPEDTKMPINVGFFHEAGRERGKRGEWLQLSSS